MRNFVLGLNCYVETAQTFKTVFTECIDKMNISQDVATSSKESDGLGYTLCKQLFIDATCSVMGGDLRNLSWICGMNSQRLKIEIYGIYFVYV